MLIVVIGADLIIIFSVPLCSCPTLVIYTSNPSGESALAVAYGSRLKELLLIVLFFQFHGHMFE
jgi:hypothetical protein